MPACTTCNVCDQRGTFAGAQDVARIPCNVRRFRHESFTVWRCTGCRSLHCAEDADLPHFYADYPLQHQTTTFHERIGYANRLRLIEAQGFRRHHRLLDFGCGAGLFVDFLRARGAENVHGYDPFVPAHADPRTLQERFDAVVSYDVIEHDDEPRRFVAHLAQLVKPGGLLVLGTPNAAHVSLARKADPSLHVPYHRHILSESALLSLGTECELDAVQVCRRSFYDSLYPTVNSRFMWGYIARCGVLDAVNEPPQPGLVWTSPTLLFAALFGYFFPRGDSMMVTFRKPAGEAASSA